MEDFRDRWDSMLILASGTFCPKKGRVLSGWVFGVEVSNKTEGHLVKYVDFSDSLVKT